MHHNIEQSGKSKVEVVIIFGKGKSKYRGQASKNERFLGIESADIIHVLTLYTTVLLYFSCQILNNQRIVMLVFVIHQLKHQAL